MTQWYVKELSKLTQISAQTLHHYDRIGLLKPSLRLPNGYRLYSERDLLKLQQIIALKFFGFKLSKIKKLLSEESDVIQHFAAQAQFLQEKGRLLLEASQTLSAILTDCKKNKSISWETIIQIIEVYRMNKQLESSWVAKALSEEELQEYASFQRELQTSARSGEKEVFEKKWKNLTNEIAANLAKDPTSDLGYDIAKRCMEMINRLYGPEYAKLKHTIWKKGFKGGQGEEQHGLSKDVVLWLDKAIDSYYRTRIYTLLAQVKTETDEKMLQPWQDLLTEMYGDNQKLKDELITIALQDDKISTTAKKWLKK